jgi:hypothetical protein
LTLKKLIVSSRAYYRLKPPFFQPLFGYFFRQIPDFPIS